MSANVNLSDSPPVSFSKPPMMSTKLSPSLASSVRLSLASTSSNALLAHSSPSLTTASKSGTNCKLGATLLSGTPLSIASSRVRHWRHSHQKGMLSGSLPQLHSIFSIMNDMANELLHGGFTNLFIKFFNILIKV